MEAIGPVVSEFVGWSDAAIGSIGGPTLLIVGDQEFVRPGARRADARAFVPDAQLAVLPGTTHMQVIRRTDALLALVEPFLGRSGCPSPG
jgi:pimeloyl-ACP methyl ester carboxylesterase